MMVKEAGVNAGLKLNMKKTKIMATGPITHVDGEKKNQKLSLILFTCVHKTHQMVTAVMKIKRWLLVVMKVIKT